MDVLVLQHIACEPPGVYEDVLHERSNTLSRVEVDTGEALPSWRDFDAIVAMGGPMSANDEETLPWLRDEKVLVAEAVRAGTPFWGVCLGVQLLAASLGAPIYPGPRPEVGVLPVELTEDALDDPVFAALPRRFLTLQWHGETFDLPDGAVRLAGSEAYPNRRSASRTHMACSSTSRSRARWFASGRRCPSTMPRWSASSVEVQPASSSAPSRSVRARCSSMDEDCSNAGSTTPSHRLPASAIEPLR